MLDQGSGRSKTKRWLVRFPRAMPVAIFLLIAAITVLSVFAIERGEDARAAGQLRSRTACERQQRLPASGRSAARDARRGPCGAIPPLRQRAAARCRLSRRGG